MIVHAVVEGVARGRMMREIPIAMFRILLSERLIV